MIENLLIEKDNEILKLRSELGDLKSNFKKVSFNFKKYQKLYTDLVSRHKQIEKIVSYIKEFADSDLIKNLYPDK
jgi:hypothetical protein